MAMAMAVAMSTGTTRASGIWLALVLAGCSGGDVSDGSSDARSLPQAAIEAAAGGTLPLEYGTHQPNGEAAVKYALGPEGMWKEVDAAEYRWNFYAHCASPQWPLDKHALLTGADGTQFFTAPDADCNLLWDANSDGRLDLPAGAHAFHEHNGAGAQGQQLAAPFTNFWFDDNWLARYMTGAYGYAAPDGLRAAPRVRWRILEGDATNWSAYQDATFDRLALDGIYYLARGAADQALQKWQEIRDRSGYFYDTRSRRYVYPAIDENYHLALFAILTAHLMDSRLVPAAAADELCQHWIALRSNILSNQERRGEQLLGWRSSIGNLGSLMNTETIALSVMALGAGAVAVFEAGQAPLQTEARGYTRTSDNVLAAIPGTAEPGYMTLGSPRDYPAGRYQVQFFLRSPAPGGDVAKVEIVDAAGVELATRQVSTADLMPSGTWRRIDLTVELAQAANSLSLRTYWSGAASMEIAAIRVRRI
jgi:hypothetical protein